MAGLQLCTAPCSDPCRAHCHPHTTLRSPGQLRASSCASNTHCILLSTATLPFLLPASCQPCTRYSSLCFSSNQPGTCISWVVKAQGRWLQKWELAPKMATSSPIQTAGRSELPQARSPYVGQSRAGHLVLPAHLPAPQAGGTGSAGLQAAGTTRHRDGCAVQPAALRPRDFGCFPGLPQRKTSAPDLAEEGPSCLRSRRTAAAAAGPLPGHGEGVSGRRAPRDLQPSYGREFRGVSAEQEDSVPTQTALSHCQYSCPARAQSCATPRPPPPPRDAHRPVPLANPVFAFPVGPSAFTALPGKATESR